MAKYLYGASVQGIQKFIFQTNELKDIIGASELVEEVCNTKIKGAEPIIGAAGNIKCILGSDDDLKEVVRTFPKDVMINAPGIVVSQAFVPIKDDESDYGSAIMKLENKLKVQRNKPMNSLTVGLMGIQRSRRTGLPAVVLTEDEKKNCLNEKERKAYDKKELFLDQTVKLKRLAAHKGNFNVARKNGIQISDVEFYVDRIPNQNDWVAVVHIDGNGLGKIVEKIGGKKKLFKAFSENLSKSTEEATQFAYDQLKSDEYQRAIRPLVIGGDDYTFIIRGSLAVGYVRDYLSAFQQKTKQYLFDNPKEGLGEEMKKIFPDRDYLTACAGIAFIKSSYPFYYGYDLAEALCANAKKVTRDKSSLMFHKVQDSFVEDWSEIARRELQPKTEDKVSFEFGPYFLGEPVDTHWTISQLVTAMNDFNDEAKDIQSLKTHLRRWLSIVHESGTNKAQENLNRMKMLFNKKDEDVVGKYIIEEHRKDSNGEDWEVYPTYDILSLSSVTYQQTKDTEDNE